MIEVFKSHIIKDKDEAELVNQTDKKYVLHQQTGPCPLGAAIRLLVLLDAVVITESVVDALAGYCCSSRCSAGDANIAQEDIIRIP
jgi:hypothetical protein